MRRGVLIILAVTVLGTLVGAPAQAVPSNDDFGDATTIVNLDHADTLGAEGATTEPGEPAPSCQPNGVGQTVWWKFTPAQKVSIKANTYQSSYDTVLALYHQGGSSLASLEPLACSDNVGPQKTSRVTHILSGGETYYFQVGSKSVTPVTLKFRVKVRKWKVGITRGNDWFLNDLFDGTADSVFEYGVSTDKKLAGAWAGNGVDTPWLRRGSLWLLNDWFDASFAKQFNYGASTDFPLAGDWNGDGIITPGVRRGNVYYLNNSFDGIADVVFAYGSSTDHPMAADWDGDGDWTIGIRRGNVWYVNNDLDSTHNVAPFAYGSSSDYPVVGDWDGDGDMTPGVVRSAVWYLNNDFNPTHDVPAFAYGSKSDRPIVGDWNGIVE
jgi:hypothetical protein